MLGVQKEFDNIKIKDITANIDLKPIKQQAQEVNKVMNIVKSSLNGTEKQQELLIEKIRQKKEELANIKENGVPSNATDDEIKAKMKEIGKVPELVDEGKIITIEAEIEKLENRLSKLQNKSIQIFDPNDVNFTINMKKEITGVSREFSKMTGKKVDLGNAVEIKNYNDKLRETVRLSKQIENSKGKFIGYNSNAIQNYIGINGQSKVNTIKENSNIPDLKSNESLSFWDTLKNKIMQAKKAVSDFLSSTKGKSGFSKMIPQLNGISGITVKIKNQIKQWSTGFKNGLGHILKYAGALFSLRGIYSILSNSASSWLSSQNAGAKQLSANIEYMKTAMGSALAPVIQYVTNLIYQLMRAIQSVVYAFSGINIFAKATASSMKNTAGSAKQASKSLSSVHSEISNVSENNSGGTNPNIDLSQMDTQMGPLAQKLYDFFKPLKDSWDNYGNMVIEQLKTTAGQVGGLISTVWQSFEKIITNGTIYKTMKSILAIIGNIAQAFKNAWKNNENGDKIVQNLADALNNVLNVIELITQSSIFQWILDTGISAIEVLTEAIEFVTEKLSEFIGFFIGENQEQLDAWSIIIGSVAAAILLVNGALAIYNTVVAIAAIVTGALTNPINLVILVIGVLIAAIIEIVTHWDEISKVLSDGWDWIKQKAEEIFGAIADFFTNTWTGIRDTISNIITEMKNTITDIWNNVLDTTSNVWNTIVSKVKEGVFGAWNAITSAFGNVAGWFRDKFTQAWQAVKNVFSTGGAIFDGIKDGILNGLKTVINGLIQGINKVIKVPFDGLNSALNTIRNVGIGDLKPFTGLPSISVPQIPQLAKGGVLYDATIAMMGEYSGAKSNPEIVTPQNIMYETTRRAFEDAMFSSNNNGQDIYLTLKVGDEEMAQVVIDKLGNIVRNTGKGLETIVEGV